MKLPIWANEIKTKYKTGVSNAFVISGNIGDYAIGQTLFSDYLDYFLQEELNVQNIVGYTLTNGAEVRLGDGVGNATYRDICRFLKDSKKRTAIIMSYPEFLVPGENLSEEDRARVSLLHSAINSSEFMTSGNLLIFVTESARNIHPMFVSSNSKITITNIDLPDYNSRKEFICNVIRDSDCRLDITIDNFAMLTSGLTLINVEDIVLAANGSSVTRDMVLDRKKELIRKEFGEIIEILDTDGFGLDQFAGQEHLKEYFRDVIIDALKDGDTSVVPKGVLLMGPPGTGKTYFSRCLAGDAGINFVEFKMSKILDKWVGESEKRMEKALSVFRALAPVGVFMDEIDQSVSRGGENSHSVNKNIFGMLLAEMSKPENRGKIIWLGATNYPDKIDEALKRPGRFDKKLPFFAPTDEERSAVFKIHLKKTKMVPDINKVNVNVLVENTKGYTQAEIEGIVLKAMELAKRKRESQINDSHLARACEFMMTTQNSKIAEMEDLALKDCNDREFVPAAFRERQRALLGK